GATKGKSGERERGDVRCWCSLGLDWVWTGLILFIMILLRSVSHPPGEFLYIFTFAHTYRHYTRFPLSVGIAGSRSSSYYSVGSQADNLFYLDPHHVRPAVPRRPPPPNPPPLTFESRPRQMTPKS